MHFGDLIFQYKMYLKRCKRCVSTNNKKTQACKIAKAESMPLTPASLRALNLRVPRKSSLSESGETSLPLSWF